MGLFESLWDAVSGVARMAGRGIGSIVESAGNYFGSKRVADFGVSMRNACSNVGEKVSKINTVKDHRSETTARLKTVNDILVEFSEDMEEQAEEIEEQCISYVEDYFDSLIDMLENEGEVVTSNMNMKKLYSTKKKMQKDISGAVQKEIAKKVSLDNAKCAKILQIENSRERGKKMNEFCTDVVKGAVNKLDKKVKKVLEKQNSEIAEILEDYAQKKELELENMMKRLAELEEIENEVAENVGQIQQPVELFVVADAIIEELTN